MKKPISVSETTTCLQQAFAEAKPATCRVCKFPVPYWGPAAGTTGGYWYLKLPPPCPEKCQTVIIRLWAAFTIEHDIQRERYDAGSHREQRAISVGHS